MLLIQKKVPGKKKKIIKKIREILIRNRLDREQRRGRKKTTLCGLGQNATVGGSRQRKKRLKADLGLPGRVLVMVSEEVLAKQDSSKLRQE